MSLKERIRLDAMGRVKRKELSVVSAAEVMGVSLRQARRMWKRFSADGDAGLVHRLRGQVSNRRLSEEVRQRAVKLHQEKYADFGPTLACEKLAGEGLVLSPDTLSALLKERGLWRRRRRRDRHRQRRERRASFGSMVQMDGSHHDWFEGRGGKCVLMVMIDDATSRTYARFYAAETMEAAMDVFGRWVKRQGIPRSVYVDRHSIYRDEDHPEKPTQFGRAMKELGVELIRAHSPQAKGRVERRNAVFQDRLVKEMRLRKINDMQQGNALLESSFLKEMNDRYAFAAGDDQDLHRAVERGLCLEEVLCVQEKRTVGRDWCVRWRNRWLQIDAEHQELRLAGRQVTVKELATGDLRMEHASHRLRFSVCGQKPAKPLEKKPTVNNRHWKPSATHPWKVEAACEPRPPALPAPATPTRGVQAEKRKKAG
ncbi:MAG: ISNCY family transposase [Phycisphaerae bacterium]|nr:ISNCY family transposase [Phycisphaerae bacterium]